MVFIPPEVPVDEILVFVFIVEIGKGDVVAAFALLVGPVVFSGVVTSILSFGGLVVCPAGCGPLVL